MSVCGHPSSGTAGRLGPALRTFWNGQLTEHWGRQMENTIIRSTPCPDCGAEMLWTQNAWRADSDVEARAAYRCPQGHLLDPSTTRQCPACGVHDTTMVRSAGGRQDFCCARCGQSFTFPRS